MRFFYLVNSLSDKPIAHRLAYAPGHVDRPFRVRALIQEFLPRKLSGLSKIDVHLGGRGRTLFNRERYVHCANVNGRYSLTSSYLLFSSCVTPAGYALIGE